MIRLKLTRIKNQLYTQATDLLTSLVSYWKLDEEAGARYDSVGVNHLTEYNTVYSEPGKKSRSARFSRVNTEYLQIPYNPTSLVMGNIDFTIAGWVKIDSFDTNIDFMSKWNVITGTNNNEFLLRCAPPGLFQWYISTDGTDGGNVQNYNLTSPSPESGKWYFLSYWHDSVNDTLNMQINNDPPSTISHTGGVFAGNSNFVMGALSPNHFHMQGQMDEWGIWKRVLTSGERTYLYNKGQGQTYPFYNQFSPTGIPGLKLWLRANDVTGANGVEVTSWDDASSVGNKLTGFSPTSSRPTFNSGTLTSGDFNSLPVIRFSNSIHNDIYTSSGFAIPQPFTIFTVAATDPAADGGPLTDGGVASSRYHVPYVSNGYPTLFFGNSLITPPTGISRNVMHVWTAVATGTSSSYYQDGDNTFSNMSSNPGTNGASGIILGSNKIAGGGGEFSGFLGEVLIYTGALSTGDIYLVNSYLKEKWNIRDMIVDENFELGGTPYGWFKGFNADFDYTGSVSGSVIQGKKSLRIDAPGGDYAVIQPPALGKVQHPELWIKNAFKVERFPNSPDAFGLLTCETDQPVDIGGAAPFIFYDGSVTTDFVNYAPAGTIVTGTTYYNFNHVQVSGYGFPNRPGIIRLWISKTPDIKDAVFSYTTFFNTTGFVYQVRTLYSPAGNFLVVQDNFQISHKNFFGSTGIFDSSLIGYWRLDEGAGTTFVDAGPSGLANGTLVGTTIGWTGGRFKGGIYLDPSTVPHAEVPHNAALNLYGNWTISCWAKMRAVNNGPFAGMWFVGKDSHTGFRGYTFGLWGDGTGVRPSSHLSGNVYTSDGPYVNNCLSGWHHFAVTYDSTLGASALKFYYDGVYNGKSAGTIPGTGVNALYLGAREFAGSQEVMDGSLDEVKIFSRVLTPIEILAEVEKHE